MTLKEKLEVEIMDLPIMEEAIDDIAKNLEYVADDFTIGFADWKDENCFKAKGIALWLIPESDECTSAYTNKQLLEIYKKEEGL